MASADKTPCCASDPIEACSRRASGPAPRNGRQDVARLLVVAFLCVGRPGALHAEPRPGLTLDLFAGGGFDSNLFLQVAALPESPAYRPYSGWFGRLAPSVVASLAGDALRAELSAGSDIRTTIGSGTLFTEEVHLSMLVPELGPVGLQVAASGGRFDASIDSALRFFTFGGLAQATWRVNDRWRARASYRAAWRAFGAPAQVGIDTDRFQTAGVRVVYAARSNLDLGATADYGDLRSNLDLSGAGPTSVTVARLQRGLVGVEATYTPSAPLSVFASTWGGLQSAAGAATSRQMGAAAALALRTGRSLDVIARYDFLASWSADPVASGTADYRRHVVTVGLAGHLNVVKPSSGRIAAPPSSQAPEPTGHGVRFRLRTGTATSVVVIGSWNDWAIDATAQRLQPTREPNMWEGWVAVPPGDHRYHFLVDGRPARPADAPRYRPDGFGGEDGVLEISP